MDDVLTMELSDDERSLLRWGLLEWGGPASPTDDLARIMGFESAADLYLQARRLAEAVRTDQGLTRLDWTRALVATEFVWASDVFGSGLDAVLTSGFSDTEGVVILRSIQRKLSQAQARVSGRSLV
ncbi:hypothetical protein [Nocardioides sp. SYSU D00038]|uniref:hypothetical protein n=1 Tax=Nocardioides sp. SYSU D00038 TaxID=2812554 RepID=UPI001966DE3E|nr:hypothetical protein [Nocardioides sp. SYSU D00038]